MASKSTIIPIFVLCFLCRSVFAATISFFPCQLPQMEEQADCAKYDVYENRETKERKITIRIGILRATEKQAAEDPIFVFGGGPGQAASDIADFAASHFAAIRSNRDLVFVDIRGTYSNRLGCDLYGPDLKSYFGDLFPKDRLTQCRANLETRADLKLYTTTEIVKDLEEIRSALGYKKINVYGTSYGTRVALVYMRMFPESLRAVILHGPAPTDLNAPLYHAWAGQQSLNAIFDQCEADKKCHDAFPNLRKEFQGILAKLDEGKVTAEVVDSDSQEKALVPLSRGVFGESLRNLLYNPERAAKLPLWIHQAYQGDFRNFAQANLVLRKMYQQGLAFGMFHSVCCAEDVPYITKEDVQRETKDTFLGDYRIVQQQKACEIWPRGSIPSNFRDPVESNVPALVVTGELDPVTPPRFAKEVASHLSQSKLIIVKGGSHSGGDACLDSVMVSFIRAANPKIDDSCLSKESSRLNFVLQ